MAIKSKKSFVKDNLKTSMALEKKKWKPKEKALNIDTFVPPVDELFPLPNAPRVTITEAEYRRLQTMERKMLDLFQMAKALDGLVVLCKIKSEEKKQNLGKK